MEDVPNEHGHGILSELKGSLSRSQRNRPKRQRREEETEIAQKRQVGQHHHPTQTRKRMRKTDEEKQQHWYLAPFDHIPNELTAYILSFTRDGGWNGIAGCVCRHWRELVVYTNGGIVPKLFFRCAVVSVSLLEWATRNQLPNSVEVCAAAAEKGNLAVLQWAHQNGYPWDEWTTSGAAGGGHLEVLKWAHQNRCPWNEKTCYRAAIEGHLSTLQWA
jgi:hypothetical protein